MGRSRVGLEGVKCYCDGCSSDRAPTPAVVISRGKDPDRPDPPPPPPKKLLQPLEHQTTTTMLYPPASTVDRAMQDHNITFRNVKEFVDGGILKGIGEERGTQKDSTLLIYLQIQRGCRQVGICAALAVEDCLKGSIKRHEKVTKDVTTLAKGNQLSSKVIK